jgi:hypothetical protein
MFLLVHLSERFSKDCGHIRVAVRRQTLWSVVLVANVNARYKFEENEARAIDQSNVCCSDDEGGLGYQITKRLRDVRRTEVSKRLLPSYLPE